MDAQDADLLFGTELVWVGAVGLLGWIVSVWCIVDKHRQSEEKAIHLVNDVLKATFVSITMVAAVNISLQVALHFPELLARFSAAEQRDADARTKKIADAIQDRPTKDELEDELRRLAADLTPERPRHSLSLNGDLAALEETGDLNHQTFERVAKRHGIQPSAKYTTIVFQVPSSNHEFVITRRNREQLAYEVR